MTGLWIRRSALMLVLWPLAGCENLALENDPVDIPRADPVDIPRADPLERWACGDYVDGCGFGGCPVVLTADLHNGSGTVEFAGTVEQTRFEIRGLGRRWDWCLQDDGNFGCAFVLDTDGDGSYYDFTQVMPDTDGTARTKPAELFKCTRRRITGT